MRLTRTSPAPLVAMIFISLLASLSPLSSQYLLLDEYDSQKEEIDTKENGGEVPFSVARKIKAQQLEGMKGVIRITFEVHGNYSDDFLVGRSTSMIDSKTASLAAETVQIVKSAQTNEVLDFVGASGAFYYTALSKRRIAGDNILLVKDENFTSLPVVITPEEVYYHVRDITAKTLDMRKVVVTWQKLPKTGLIYRVYRAARRLDQHEKLSGAVRILEAPDLAEYTDAGIEIPGTYFYAVVAMEPSRQERMYPFPGHNYTVEGVYVNGTGVSESALYKVRSIDASTENKGVRVNWTYTGTLGGRFYRIFRTTQIPGAAEEIPEEMFISDSDITKKSFFDPLPQAGDLYYGILPYGYLEEKTPLVRGINIIERAVKVETSRKEAEQDKAKKSDPALPDDAGKGSDVDAVLHRTFFRGKFNRCVKELQNIIPAVDNDTDKARAKLFIARSYIEMGKYRKALDYLLLEDVTRHYPKESRFWQSQALRKIR